MSQRITLRPIASSGTEMAHTLHGSWPMATYPPPSFDLRGWMKARGIRPSEAAPLLGIRGVEVFDLMGGRAEPVEGWDAVCALLEEP